MGTIRLTVRRAQQRAEEAARILAAALRGRHIGGDVCLSVEECEELIQSLGQSSKELDDLLARRGE